MVSASTVLQAIEEGALGDHVLSKEEMDVLRNALRAAEGDGWTWSLDQPEVSAWRWIETWDASAMSFGVLRFHLGDKLDANVACWRYIDPPPQHQYVGESIK